MSFSVVQKITFGSVPPALPRSARKNDGPSMTGIFQSRRMASGIPWPQRSSASIPSPASETLNASSSRMRRAILRTTPESSTTRQVFIVVTPFVATARKASGSERGGNACECPLDVEDEKQLAGHAVDAGEYPDPASIDIDRARFEFRRIKAQDLADFVDDEAEGLAFELDSGGHVDPPFGRRQAEKAVHVDHRHDAAA